MPRKTRVEYAGALYHVMDRGNRAEPIFFDDRDRGIFLKTLGETCERCGWLVHCYVLMGNHYHLLLETPQANLSRGMGLLQGIYTIRHNARHRLRGHLFQGRYKAVVVDGADATYFRTVCDYIHLNPVRAGLLAADDALESFAWSSFPAHAGSPEKRPRWLASGWVLAETGGADTESGRNAYRHAMEKRAAEERDGGASDEGMRKALKRGWCFGSEQFRESLLEKMEKNDGAVRANEGSEIIKTHDEQAAEKLIVLGLNALGITAADLADQPKSSVTKIALARVIKEKTTVTNAWIAERLKMGASTRVSRYCGQAPERAEVQELIAQIKMATGES